MQESSVIYHLIPNEKRPYVANGGTEKRNLPLVKTRLQMSRVAPCCLLREISCHPSIGETYGCARFTSPESGLLRGQTTSEDGG